MDEIELDQRAWGKHERIKIARSHNAVDTVHCKNERQPRVRDGIKGLDGIGSKSICADNRLPCCGLGGLLIQRRLFPRYRRCGDSAPRFPRSLPNGASWHRQIRNAICRCRRRARRIMSLKRYVIIHHPVISEDRTTGLKLAAVVDENIPEVMPDLVTEMSQQRPIWLVHL